MTDTFQLRPPDAENLAGQDTGRDHLSHSSISDFINCARKYELARVRRLEPIRRKESLSLGSAFQKAVELKDPHGGAQLLRDDAVILTQEDEDKLRIDEAIVSAAARLYLKRWPAGGGDSREYEYRVRLRNPWTGHYSRTFDLLGYADGMSDEGDWLTLTENKFVTKVGQVDVKKLPLDRQVSLACYGLWRATGKRVAVVNYRFVKKPSIKQRQGRTLKDGTVKGAETVDEFIARLTKDYEDRPDFYSHEEPVYRDDKDLLRVEGELWTWAEQLRVQRRADLFPRNSSHCSDYGGCPFIPLCTGDPDAEHLYRVRPVRTPETIEEVAAA